MTTHSERAERRRYFGLGRNVFALGIVSFLTDVSSEMTITLLPLFLSNVLGVRTTVIGLIEGIAEASASLLKIGSGWLSDRFHRRKVLVLIGYGLSALSKPFLGFAGSWPVVLALRFTDRVGKGIRTSPRDALLADSTDEGQRGRAFGYHRTADTGGAVVGLALTALIIGLMQRGTVTLARETYRNIVLVGVIPGFLAVVLLALLLKERFEGERATAQAPRPQGGARASFQFDARFWRFLVVIVLFTLGNSSDAFLLLRAQGLGLSAFHIALLLVGFNILYAGIAMPAGNLSDRWGRRPLLVVGWGIYALVYLGFALAGEGWQVLALFVLYGLYYGTTEGTARALVADVVASERRGSAYGLYHTSVGLAALPASVIAGWLWQTFSPATPFYFGAALAGLAALLLMTWAR